MNYYDDPDEIDVRDCCPVCGEPYDEIDQEYHICSICGHHHIVADTDQGAEDSDPNDSRNL